MMELLDDVYKLIRAFIGFKDLPEGCAVNGVNALVKSTKTTYNG